MLGKEIFFQYAVRWPFEDVVELIEGDVLSDYFFYYDFFYNHFFIDRFLVLKDIKAYVVEVTE